MDKSTVVFNVGGKVFEVSMQCVYKSEVLTSIANDNPGGVVFLDYNYDAFAVVLDFLRHDRILVPPSVNTNLVQLLLEELKVYLTEGDKKALQSSVSVTATSSPLEDCPPQYFPSYSTPPGNEKRTFDTNPMASTNLTDQLTLSVHQKIANLIISTIRPRIESQALQGAYHTTYLLLPPSLKSATLMSKFPTSTFTELVYLDSETEKFLRQSPVMGRFEDALRRSLEVPMKIGRKDVFFRSENEFGILGTTTIDAIVIDFELGRRAS